RHTRCYRDWSSDVCSSDLDNGAGTIVAMEVMRVLKSLGVAPKRTIRIGLWTGEEEGLLGSRAYVAQHFASRPEPPADERDLPSRSEERRVGKERKSQERTS